MATLNLGDLLCWEVGMGLLVNFFIHIQILEALLINLAPSADDVGWIIACFGQAPMRF
jgi:hypothetical protein